MVLSKMVKCALIENLEYVYVMCVWNEIYQHMNWNTLIQHSHNQILMAML